VGPLGEVQRERVDDALRVAVHPRRVEHPLAGVALVALGPVAVEVGGRVAGVDGRDDGPVAVERQVGRLARHRGVGHVDDEPVLERRRVDRAGVEPVDRLERAVGEGGVVDGGPPALVCADGFDHDPPVAAELGEPVAPHPAREVVVIGRVHVARDAVRELRDVLDVDRIERHGRTAVRRDIKYVGSSGRAALLAPALLAPPFGHESAL
jgi:hypothetical protein